MQLPAAAPVTEGLGSVNASGVRSRGVTLATSRGAPVTAPAGGIVRFAGPFRDYDGMVMIDHGGGWMSLIVNVAWSIKRGRSGGPRRWPWTSARADRRSNCPKMGGESRPLSSQVHLEPCQMAGKAAKSRGCRMGRDHDEIESQTSSAARARRSARPGPGDRQLLRCRGHHQLPGAREIHERLRAGEGELCRAGRRPYPDQGRDRWHAVGARPAFLLCRGERFRPAEDHHRRQLRRPGTQRFDRGRSGQGHRPDRGHAGVARRASRRATTSPTSTASWSTA